MPFAGITVSSRESVEFRNGIIKIAATKVSAGVSIQVSVIMKIVNIQGEQYDS